MANLDGTKHGVRVELGQYEKSAWINKDNMIIHIWFNDNKNVEIVCYGVNKATKRTIK